MSGVLSVRVDDDTFAMFDRVAAERGMLRGELLHHLVDRALAGEGLLTTDEVAARREARAVRSQHHAMRVALRAPEAAYDPSRYPTAEDIAQ